MGLRANNKVSKKVKLSKGKINYRKFERTRIHRFKRRQSKAELRQS